MKSGMILTSLFVFTACGLFPLSAQANDVVKILDNKNLFYDEANASTDSALAQANYATFYFRKASKPGNITLSYRAKVKHGPDAPIVTQKRMYKTTDDGKLIFVDSKTGQGSGKPISYEEALKDVHMLPSDGFYTQKLYADMGQHKENVIDFISPGLKSSYMLSNPEKVDPDLEDAFHNPKANSKDAILLNSQLKKLQPQFGALHTFRVSPQGVPYWILSKIGQDGVIRNNYFKQYKGKLIPLETQQIGRGRDQMAGAFNEDPKNALSVEEIKGRFLQGSTNLHTVVDFDQIISDDYFNRAQHRMAPDPVPCHTSP